MLAAAVLGVALCDTATLHAQAAAAATQATVGPQEDSFVGPAPVRSADHRKSPLSERIDPGAAVLARRQSYDKATVERDFNSLWNSGYFENVIIEGAEGAGCVQLIVYVREKPTIGSIEYKGPERRHAV